MIKFCTVIQLLFFAWALPMQSFSQSPVDKAMWLSLVNNPFNKLQLAASPACDSLNKLPLSQRTEILNSLEADKNFNKNPAVQARLDLVKANTGYISGKVVGDDNWRHWAFKTVAAAEKSGDDYLLQSCYFYIGNNYAIEKNYDSCVFYQVKGVEFGEKLGFEPAALANWKILAANTLYYTRNNKEALAFSLYAIKHISYDAPYPGISGLNVTGLSYSRLKQDDSAKFYFQKLVKHAEKFNSGVWAGIAKGNIGDALYLAGKEEEAMPWWKADYDSSMKYGEIGNAVLTLAYISRYEFRTGNREKAMQQLRWSLNHTANTDISTKTTISKIAANCFEQIGLPDSANYYNRFYFQHTDSMNQIISRNNYNLVRLRLDFDKKNNEVAMVKKERQAEILRRNFLLGLLIVAVVVGLLFYNRQRLKIKLARKQNELVRAEMYAARQQLDLFTHTLLEKNEQIEKLTLSLHGQNAANNDELVHQTLLTEEDWIRFKNLFEKTHPGFFDKIKEKAPGITAAEIRLAALVKLGLDNKQMASMQGISLSGLRATKTRLRQKMNLSGEEDLEQIILSA